MTLMEIFEKMGRPTDKGTCHNYIEIYNKELNKKNKVNLLEIGIHNGGSLILWDEWFDDAEIYGIDPYFEFNGILPESVSVLPYKIFTIDSTVKEKSEIFEDGMFDYIIDDGVHTSDFQIKTFNIYFNKLSVGGKYFIEDIASDEDLDNLKKHLSGFNYKVVDLRHLGRYDDLMIIVEK
jgi:hypothetical protein